MQDISQLRSLGGKHVLVRIDTDVDVVHNRVVDDSRLRAALPTIRLLLSKGAIVSLIGHMGRPKGKVKSELSLKPVATRLAHLLVPHSHMRIEEGLSAHSPVLSTRFVLAKNVVLYENLRFDAGEDSNEKEFVDLLAHGQDIFVNESFATSHREAASTVGITKRLDSYAGLRLVDELAHLDILTQRPDRPLTLVVGGAKVEEKVGLLKHLIDKVDTVLTGGVTANIFLKAKGIDVRRSKVEDVFVDLAEDLLDKHSDKIMVPTDFLWDGPIIADIGPETALAYQKVLSGSKTIFWAGTMGIVEDEKFAAGSRAIASTLAKHKGIRICGGGDTGTALKIFNLEDKMSFISTGGGAALEYLAGKELPGVDALR